MNFLNAERISGFELFAKYTDIEKCVKASDIIITGERKNVKS